MARRLIDAVLDGGGEYAGKTYFFQGERYARYDAGADAIDPGYPQPLRNWNLPADFAHGVDAALQGQGAYAGKAYFFKGGLYVRHDWQADAIDAGYPMPLSAWKLPGDFAHGIDAAFNGQGAYAGKAYFFKGGQYVRFDWASDAVDPGYPMPLSAWNLPADWARGIDDAWSGTGRFAGKLYLFRGDQYLRYDWATDTVDAGYPLPIVGNWGGIGEALSTPRFQFALRSGESIPDRVVRCCRESLADGPMGESLRHDVYRDFIACGQERTPEAAEALTHVRTSCAMFVRAIRHHCGTAPEGPYVPGTGMFVSMGNVSFSHAAFVRHDGTNVPQPGHWFYIASTQSSNDGHTGIFLEQVEPGEWVTAEGGGGDGTKCQITRRKIAGTHFADDARTLWGWFDCSRVGLPPSP